MKHFNDKLDIDFVQADDADDAKLTPSIKTFRALSKEFSLLPLDGKRPQEKGWTKWCRKKRPFKESDFKGLNAGVCCGPASEVIVLDVDDRKLFMGLKNGLRLKLPKTLKVKTGGGGVHYYYRHPKGKKWGNKSLKHPIFKKLTIFDIRGDGGVVVAPGSIHPDTGRRYKVIADHPIASCPNWIVKYLMTDEIDTGYLLDNPLPKPDYKKFIKALKIPDGKKKTILTEPIKGTRSEKVFGVISSLINGGYDKKAIVYIFEHYPIGDKYREKGSGKKKWLLGEIARARSKNIDISIGEDLVGIEVRRA